VKLDKKTEKALAAVGIKGEALERCTIGGKPLTEVAAARPTITERVAILNGFASKAEADLAWELDILWRAGEIKRWKYNPIKGGLRLSEVDPQTKRCRTYRPDFLVEWADGWIEWIEVKGRMKWEDALKTFDWARQEFTMFHFRMVEKIGGEWRTIRGENNKHEEGRT
jgi:hypothetical protein